MGAGAKVLAVASVVLAASAAAGVEAQGSWGILPAGSRPPRSFAEVIAQVERMPQDGALQARVAARELHVVNVMWEDTGRFQGSSIGPNISDMTLQVREPVPGGGTRTHLLPVIRYPNFSDRTADVRADRLWVRVGNHRRGGALETVPLTEVLGHLRTYLSDPSSLLGSDDFIRPRDTHFLVSAQHVFVPLPATGQAEFNPVLFNYQSAPESPAVLALLITRQGTSATIIENRPGDQSMQQWGQQLFFNHEGQRTTFTAERRSAVAARIEAGEASAQDEGALEEGADMMMVVQVPLRHRDRGVLSGYGSGYGMGGAPPPAAAPAPTRRSRAMESDVEQAVLGHGDDLGPFREMGGLRLERDPRFPIRVTVQFYRATSNGVLSDADLDAVRRTIDRVYEDGDFVGSLVVPRDERRRPTDWTRFRQTMRVR
jgi:hypothetical protein